MQRIYFIAFIISIILSTFLQKKSAALHKKGSGFRVPFVVAIILLIVAAVSLYLAFLTTPQ